MVERKPNPTDAKTYYQTGNDYYEKGDYDKGIENYNMAILLNPVFSEAYFNRALSYYQLKNFDAENTQLLLSLDSASLEDNPRMNRQDRHLPISWAKSYGKGRVFYTALGDWEATWRNPDYQTHLLKGIQWAMRHVE